MTMVRTLASVVATMDITSEAYSVLVYVEDGKPKLLVGPMAPVTIADPKALHDLAEAFATLADEATMAAEQAATR